MTMWTSGVTKVDNQMLLTGVQQYSQTQHEPDWLQQLRQQALQAYFNLPLPKFEKINYRDWPLFDFSVPSVLESEPVTGELAKQAATQQFYAVGDSTIQLTLPMAALRQGVILSDLRSAITHHGDLVQKYLMQKALHVGDDKLTSLNTAMMTNGFFLYVPKNVQLEAPIELLQIVDNRTTQNYFSHNLLIADSGSQVNVIQRLASVGDQANTAHVLVEVMAEANSQVNFAGIDTMSAQTTAYLNRRGYLAADAKLDWEFAEMNAGNVIADFDSELKGRGSEAMVKTIAIANQKQTQALDTRVTNYGKQTVANIVQRGIILDAATLIFNGIGHIIKGAHGAKANQENRLLMLSTKARGDANPILLIDENDVEAGHAASVGRVDEQQMYYLLSRGIPKPVAERLVIRGFLAGVITELRSQRLRQELNDVIERRLTDGQND
ncbi:Fe-S cluster assembly protein SufD [Lactiplantibacillus mudanjiangensis]|uniref:Fe-S cluster assembly protein SufD [Lactobacillus sp.] n=1 Tax=Lactiplantibacillus mudanjiangensis TaxID=1296538 RepID=A0A660E5E8_9LACO|nr:Fe-S cluster assembly protein SufD [Lactiplantibacillus mudanjiangensis]VDG26259.1 Fe-S cluster assembly protein SufD [Lactobacillus sp.] [Lactiplantibacillus mudanjiangensis]VDG27420.1 Fe-S cluster assembly protein SufD [Lactobacillus sp.] [Lactiplantibacillus mudanjiangensis]VDG33498.1 Fe-S cluster assembly protein SufD [Lactobacillus sp.] [Lactiplantibacillus mudanjiangensis]